MASDAYVLGFDTSAAHCAAALLCDGRLVSARAEVMARGQAERLVPLLQEVLTQGGIDWRDLHRIGVGTGPGNFTGIRISVATARGLALSLGVPVVGVSLFDAIGFVADGPHVPVVPAPRDQLYARVPGDEPAVLSSEQAEATALPLCFPPEPELLVEVIARVSAQATDFPAPAPLYIKPADAAPSRDAPPTILNDA